MKIGSWNLNGLRSVDRHGFADWLIDSDIDILCVQEIKIDEGSLTPELTNITGYESAFNHAEKKGYSGVGVYSKQKPLSIKREILANNRFNQEGRSLLLEFNHFSVLNLYLPHGARDKANLAYKLEVYDVLNLFLASYTGKPLILAGDFNIAHKDIDLARPKQNRNNIMFTVEEREALDSLISHGYIDSYRQLNPETLGYTWWPYMALARERNVGWRIDYVLVPEKLSVSIKQAEILPDVLGSDHCPIIVDLDATIRCTTTTSTMVE
jgi:exodeoxyribonuclease-3